MCLYNEILLFICIYLESIAGKATQFISGLFVMTGDNSGHFTSQNSFERGAEV